MTHLTLTSVGAALALAVCFSLQRETLRSVRQRYLWGFLAFLGALVIPLTAPFDAQLALHYTTVAGLALLLIVAVLRPKPLPDIWVALDGLAVSGFLAAALLSIGSLVSGTPAARPGLTVFAAYASVASAIHLLHELRQSHVLQRPSGLTFAQAFC